MMQVTDSDIQRLKDSGQFDANWYLAQYSDVAMTGIDPAKHYLKYGFVMDRDPGPEFSTVFHRGALQGIKPSQEPLSLLRRLSKTSPKASFYDTKGILPAAYKESQFGTHDRAIALAEAHLPPHLRHTLNVLRANRAIASGDERGWETGLSDYLAHFGAAPVMLKSGSALLDRLTSPPAGAVTGGPLVSVIMPAWNAEGTVTAAARSILDQTWRNLELLIVDDCSTDGTWAVLQALAASDQRVRIARNPVNVGPYVSKNVALAGARGAWVTGHDADDWALPKRLEQHLAPVMAEATPPRASLTHMIRVQPNGHFDTFSRQSNFSPDCVTRVSSISTLFQRGLLTETLGHWDCVRLGADSEMIARTRALIGAEFRTYDQIGMICLSEPTSLTNHPEFGVRGVGGLSPVRTAYKNAWTAWHKGLKAEAAYVPFPNANRAFAAPEKMLVPHASLERAMTLTSSP